MLLKSNFEFLFIGKEEDGFSKNYIYEMKGDGKNNREELFVNFQMLNNPALGEEIGAVIFAGLKMAYFKAESDDAYVRFESALKEINLMIKDLQREKEFKFIPNVNVLVGLISGENLYLSMGGEAEAYLVRRKHVSIISEGLVEDEDTGDLFSNIANGSLEHGDVIVFSTMKLLRYLTEIDLAKYFSNYDLPEALVSLKHILAKEIFERMTVLGIAMEEVEEKGYEEQEPEKPVFKHKSVNFDKLKIFKDFVFSKVVGFSDALSRNLQGRKISLKGVKIPKINKQAISAALIAAVVILAGGVYVVKSRAKENRMLGEYSKVVDLIKEDLHIAETTGFYNKKKTGDLLVEAEKKSREILESGYLRGEINGILDAIKIQRERLDNVKPVNVSQENILADLSLKRENVNALGILKLKDRMYVYEYNALYELVLNQVKDPLTIDEGETVVAATTFDDQNALVFLTKANRVIEYKDGQFTFVDTDDTAWRGGVALGTFSNKLYILNKENNQIYRYTRRRDRYGAPEQYNVNGEVNDAEAMSIDGTIYVLKQNGVIEQLYRGEKQEYTIKDQPLDSPLKATKIYTEPEMDQVYLLEPSKNRIVVYNKEVNGSNLFYSHQYSFEGLDEPLKDLYVDKTDQKIYILGQSKVYMVSL